MTITRLEQIVRSWLEKLHTSAVGQVVSWDGATRRAVVRPKYKKRLGDKEVGRVVRKPPSSEQEQGQRQEGIGFSSFIQRVAESFFGTESEGVAEDLAFPGTGQEFSAREIDVGQELDGPQSHETPDVVFINEDFGEYRPWDDTVPVVLGYFRNDSDEAVKDMDSYPPNTTRMMHPQDAFIVGGLVPDKAGEPDFGTSRVLAYGRKNPAKRLEFSQGYVWTMVGTKVIILSNDGEIQIQNSLTGHQVHISPTGSVSIQGSSISATSDDGDMSVNGTALLAKLQELENRIVALGG